MCSDWSKSDESEASNQFLASEITACLLSSRYKADAFQLGVNPYVAYGNVGHEEDQPSLVGPGMRQRKEVVYRGMAAWNKKVLAGMKDYDQAAIDDLHRAMAADIVRERQRIGGDWAVAFAVPDRRDRDVIREALGGEDAVTFVVLNLDEDVLAEHLAKKYKVGRMII